MPPSVNRYVRRVHMYLALYLMPWVLMYALSSLVFNHFATIRGWYGGDINQFTMVDEFDYKDAFTDGVTAKAAANQILRDLNLEGSHFTRGTLEGDHFIIMRQASFATKRITYYPDEGRVTLEEQKPNLPSTLLRAHTRHGLDHEYASATFWGWGVELTVLAMLFWIASGVWLWWTIKPARKWGGVCALGGVGLFALLLFSI